MKPSLVPIACGTALALMAGATAAHWCSVRDMVKLAGAQPAPRTPPSSRPQAPASLPDEGPSREAKEFLAKARDDSEKKSPQPSSSLASVSSNTDVRIEKLLHLLEGTVEENRRLRENQAETNRDLMELQFRVDMYDGEFRPLKVEEEPAPYDDGSSGVLPPLE